MFAKQRRGGGCSFPATHQSGRSSLLIVSGGTCDLSVWIEGLWKIFITSWAKILSSVFHTVLDWRIGIGLLEHGIAKVGVPKCLQVLYKSAWVKAFTKYAAYIDENPVHTNEDNDSTRYACSLCLMPLALTRGFLDVWKYSFKNICQIICRRFMQKISTQVVGPRQSQPVSGSLWRNVLSPNLRRGCKTDAKQLTSSSPSSSSSTSSSPAYKILLHLLKSRLKCEMMPKHWVYMAHSLYQFIWKRSFYHDCNVLHFESVRIVTNMAEYTAIVIMLTELGTLWTRLLITLPVQSHFQPDFFSKKANN